MALEFKDKQSGTTIDLESVNICLFKRSSSILLNHIEKYKKNITKFVYRKVYKHNGENFILQN